jgi:hypothetical protein
MNANMKTILNISVLTCLLIAVSSECFAEQRNVVVSKERAKELGVTIRSNMNGQSGVKVWLEFKPQAVLKNFTHVILEINAGGKRLVSAPLLTSRSTADSVSVSFYADPSYLATSVLTIVVQDSERSWIGYQFKMKDYIESEKSR